MRIGAINDAQRIQISEVQNRKQNHIKTENTEAVKAANEVNEKEVMQQFGVGRNIDYTA